MPGGEFMNGGSGGGNGGRGPVRADVVPPSSVGDVARKLFAENTEEIGRLCARLCQLIPPGATTFIQISVEKTQLVMADGGVIGQQSELIEIHRPLTYLAQPIKVRVK